MRQHAQQGQHSSTGQLQKNAVLPALAEALRSWARLDEKAGSRAMQEQLAGAITGLQDALASCYPHLFRHGEDVHPSGLHSEHRLLYCTKSYL